MKDLSRACLVELKALDAAALHSSAGSVVFLTGQLYRKVEVKHPRCARFSLKNKQGLFFVKVYEASLVGLAKGFEAGTELGVVGEMYSFVNRRCHYDHVFIKAATMFPLTEMSTGWSVSVENGQSEFVIGSDGSGKKS